MCSDCSFQQPEWDMMARCSSRHTVLPLAAIPNLLPFFKLPAMAISAKTSQKQGYERPNTYLITPGFLISGIRNLLK